MSIDTCKSCCRWVDTDSDTDCYALCDESGNVVKELDYCLCERCREKAENEINGVCLQGESTNGTDIRPDSNEHG